MLVSLVDIVRKLMGGDYYVGTGYPGAAEDEEEFIREIKRRVPELAGESPEDIEDKISDMLSWLINNICKPLRYTTKRNPGYLHEVGAYQCHHPQLGTFYLFHDEENEFDAAVHHLSFSLTRSKKEVLDSYRDVLSEIESEEEEW